MAIPGSGNHTPHGCAACPFAPQCLSGTDPSLQGLIEHGAPVHAGGWLFRQGDPFQQLAVVRSGSVKTVAIDRDGREQILGFHLAGDLLGLDAIDDGWHPSSAIALDTVLLCRLPFPVVARAAAGSPELQNRLFRLLSRDISRAAQLSGPHAAEERLAAFLVGMTDRLGRRGCSVTRCQLSMTRTDIASYLRLAPETLSRLLRRFQQQGLLQVEGREVELRGRERLQAMAAPILRQ